MRLFIIATMLLIVPVLQAASFFYAPCYPKDETALQCMYIEGEIKVGDYEKFYNLAFHDPSHSFLFASEIVLSSPGGTIEEAISIANVLRKAYKTTVVRSDNGVCASACFILLASGMERKWDYSSIGPTAKKTNIGLHRPYFSKEKTNTMTADMFDANNKKIAASVTDLLKSWDIPSKFIEKMMTTSSVDVYWLSATDWDEIPKAQIAFEESVIAKCDISDSRVKCTLFANCQNPEDYIMDLITNERSIKIFRCKIDHQFKQGADYYFKQKEVAFGQ